MKSPNHLLIHSLRNSFVAFWGEQLRIEPKDDGLLMAMPLMDATGWQIVLHLQPLTPTHWLVSDNGSTLALIEDEGQNPGAGRIRDEVEAQCRFYGFERDGFILQRAIAFPFDPVEIQVFAEGLASLGHICPKHRREVAATAHHQQMEDTISSYFYRRQWTPQRNYTLSGKVEAGICVDYYWEGTRALALQPVVRRRQIRGYMEQWGWRWTDIGNAHPQLVKAMVFDPDLQSWDAESLKIGKTVCDIFVPYYEANEALDAVLAA